MIPDTQLAPRVYRTALPYVARQAMLYGLPGGILTGVALQLPFRWLLGRLLSSAEGVSDTAAYTLITVGLLLAAAGLGITLAVLGRRGAAGSGGERWLTGVGVGLVFALAVHAVFVGNLVGVLANRVLFASRNPSFVPISPDVSAGMWSAYVIVIENALAALVTVISLTIAGTLLGRWLLPLQRREVTDVRDALGSLVVVVMPLTLVIAITYNTAIYSLLDANLNSSFLNSGLEVLPPNFLFVFLLPLPPYVVMIIIQLLALVWLWRRPAAMLHRRALRLAQVVYALIIGQYWFWSVIQPGFLYYGPAQVLILISSLAALVFVELAQVKLRRARRQTGRIQINIAPLNLIGVGWWVAVVSFLLSDLLMVRLLHSLALIPEITNPRQSVDGVLAIALHNGLLPFIASLLLVLIASGVVLLPLAWLLTFFERQEFNNCPRCGTLSPMLARFCPACGLDFAQPFTGAIVRRSRTGDVVRTAHTLLVPLAAGGAFVLALVGTLVLLSPAPEIRNNRRGGVGTPTPIPFVDVVIAVQDLSRGYRFPDTMDELQKVVAYVPIPEEAVPRDALTRWGVRDRDGLLGKTVTTDVYREQPIRRGMVAEGVYDRTGFNQNVAAVIPRDGFGLQYGGGTGILNSQNWIEEWRFESRAGQGLTFTLEVTDGDLQPTLMVWAEVSERWVDGERSSDGQRMTLRVVLPETGSYIASVSQNSLWAGQRVGAYRLSVR